VILVVVALASACRKAPPGPVAPSSEPQLNLLLITIDTLRADRLGRGLTPTLDRLAAGGLAFTRARTTVPLTLPAHATLLTGLLPIHHGLHENGGGRLSGHPTLATILRGRGYQTGAAIGAFVLGRQFGLNEGFQAYDDTVPRDPDRSTTLESQRRASAVTDAALTVVGGLARAGASGAASPWFLWAHYYDPHWPYDPPAAFLARANQGAYDGEVAYADSEVARLLASLPRSGSRDTLVVIAGDHGESLGEHGEATHGMLLFDGALRVPLIFARLDAAGAVAPPARGASGRRVENVSLADVAPTVLDRMGIPQPPDMDGRSLLE
jgi:arylsulfatase A-like enzyme